MSCCYSKCGTVSFQFCFQATISAIVSPSIGTVTLHASTESQSDTLKASSALSLPYYPFATVISSSNRHIVQSSHKKNKFITYFIICTEAKIICIHIIYKTHLINKMILYTIYIYILIFSLSVLFILYLFYICSTHLINIYIFSNNKLKCETEVV